MRAFRAFVGDWFGDIDPGEDAGEEVPDEEEGDKEKTEDGGDDEGEDEGEGVRNDGRLGTGGRRRGITLLPFECSSSYLL